MHASAVRLNLSATEQALFQPLNRRLKSSDKIRMTEQQQQQPREGQGHIWILGREVPIMLHNVFRIVTRQLREPTSTGEAGWRGGPSACKSRC